MKAEERAQRIRSLLSDLGDVLVEPVEVEPDDGIDRLLSVEEAADRLNLGRTLVYRMIGDGRLRSIKVGRRRLVPASAIAEIADRHDG